MANIKIAPGALSTGGDTTITLNTKDTYVLENIDVIVRPQTGSFNNAATTGVTYSDETSSATVIPSGGYLYLNKGWFDNTRISLGHLIPEIAENDAGVSHILSGYKAFDEAGNIITGTMATVNPAFDGGTISTTPSVDSLKKPKVTVSASGTFTTTGGTSYGVTSTAPSGTDGTNYLTIDGGASVTAGSVKAKADVTRAAVLYNGAYTGFIDKEDNTVVLASGTDSKTSTASSIGVDVTDDFKPLYIPIVTVTGKGGGLSKASSGNSFSITGTNPTMTVSYSGEFTTVGSGGIGASYGVTTTQPSSGTDGTNWLAIKTGGSSDAQTFSGSASIKVNRAAVQNNGAKKGAINIADSAELLAAGSDTFSHTGSVSVSAQLSGTKAYFIPIITSMPVNGGGLSKDTSNSSVSVTGDNPSVSITKSGKFTDVSSGGTGAAYGVTTTAPSSGTDGTNFLKITIGSSVTNSTITGSASIKVNRDAVVHNGAAAGAIKWTNKAQILASGNGTFTESGTKSVGATVTGETSYYIPIINLTDKGTGGVVTASATARVDSVDNPKLAFSISGSVSSHIEDFGIKHAVEEGTDGDKWFLLDIEPETNATGVVSGSVSGSWSRTAVKSNNTYKGAVSLTTNTQFLASGSGSLNTATGFSTDTVGIEMGLVTDEQKKWYFSKSELGYSGGDMEGATLSVSGTNPTVTPDINFLSRSGSTNGSAITISNYGIQTTAPTSGNWVVFDPTGSSNSQTFTGSVTAARTAVSISVSKGLTAGETGTLARATKKYQGSTSVSASVADGTSRYIPVVSPTASVDYHTITNPSIQKSETAKYYIDGTAQTSVPAGILVNQGSDPSDFSASSYIVITPTHSTTNGSSKTKGKAAISKGITTGSTGTLSSESSQSVGVTDNGSKSCYIKVYKGEYTVS